MKLSAPIYRLKRQAKLLSRAEGIPLHQALDRIAFKEGFTRWSLLAADISVTATARTLLGHFTPGDLVLLGARPGHGKTQLSLELIVEAMKSGHQGVFFTLEYSVTDILDLFKSIGEDPAVFRHAFEFDASDEISATYIMANLATVPIGTVVIIDYLQLLDQKRQNPELMTQVRTLKTFAIERGLIIVFISQIDRSFDSSARACPGTRDVRLPNPLDLKLFNKTCFLHNGELDVSTPG
ncbi:MAG: DNA helicase [Cyanobacteria bacterium P01_B01_bin.77]